MRFVAKAQDKTLIDSIVRALGKHSSDYEMLSVLLDEAACSEADFKVVKRMLQEMIVTNVELYKIHKLMELMLPRLLGEVEHAEGTNGGTDTGRESQGENKEAPEEA